MIDRISEVLSGWRPLVGRRSSASLILRIIDQIMEWQERARDRRFLATLDDRMLRDIGIDRAARPSQAFWRGRRRD